MPRLLLVPKDQYGREIVDPAYGFNVVVGNMSDSAVEINVKQMPKPMTKEEYKQMMRGFFPMLKRWRK